MEEICYLLIFLFLIFMLCEGWNSIGKNFDFDSNINGGLSRTVTVYSDTGDCCLEGKIDIGDTEHGNKRIVLYNCSVIVEEK